MSFAAPWWLLAGAVGALIISALHLLTRRDPAPRPLPTARFIPETPNRLVSRSVALSDRAILAVRLLALFAATLAFAQPKLDGSRHVLTQVILIDTSRAADSVGIDAAVRTVARSHDRSIRFSSLSAGLIAGIREARSLRSSTDSVSLVIVSPLARESFDAATEAVRSTWPTGVTWVGVEAIPRPPRPHTVAVRADADDPILSTLALSGWSTSEAASIRLVRTETLTPADSAWAAEPAPDPHLLIHWPVLTAPAGDTAGAVVTDRTVLTAAFRRSGSRVDGTARAWWADGMVAAADRPHGSGCIRRVEIPVDPAGDLALRLATRDLIRDLLVPCGGRRDAEPVDSAIVSWIRGGATVSLPTAHLPALPSEGRPSPWLLGLAMFALVAEHLLRRRSS